MRQHHSRRRRCRIWMLPLCAIVIACAVSVSHAQDIVPAPIQTPWDSLVDPDKVLPEYPRPQLVRWAQNLLPNHIVSAASGWNDVDHLGHIRDLHDYSRFPSTTLPEGEPERVVVLGETGGFGVPVNGNNWLEMPEPRAIGMTGGQVRREDRKVSKIPITQLRSIHTTLYRPLPMRQPLLPAASRWTDASGKTVSFPIQLTGPVSQAEPARKKTTQKAAAQLPAVRPHTYVTPLQVSSIPNKAALNIFLDARHVRDTFGYLLVYLDDHLIYDDMSRHKKQSIESHAYR